jgi:hypothetical protein
MTFMENGVAGFMGDGPTMMANRTQARHALLVDAFRHAIADSTVMLVGAEDGAWCYALAAAGGLQVVGIEKNANQVERFMRLPDVGLRERIDMRCADPLAELRSEVKAGRQYDVIVLFDVLNGITDLYEFFSLLVELRPRLVIADGVFGCSEDPVFTIERPREALAGLGRPYLLPSRGAVAMVAYDMGFDLDWIDWNVLDDDVRLGLSDYYAEGAKVRASFTLMPEDIE